MELNILKKIIRKPDIISKLSGMPLTTVTKTFKDGVERDLDIYPFKSHEFIKYRSIAPLIIEFDKDTGEQIGNPKVVHDGTEIRASLYITYCILKRNFPEDFENYSFKKFEMESEPNVSLMFRDEMTLMLEDAQGILKKKA